MAVKDTLAQHLWLLGVAVAWAFDDGGSALFAAAVYGVSHLYFALLFAAVFALEVQHGWTWSWHVVVLSAAAVLIHALRRPVKNHPESPSAAVIGSLALCTNIVVSGGGLLTAVHTSEHIFCAQLLHLAAHYLSAVSWETGWLYLVRVCILLAAAVLVEHDVHTPRTSD